MIFINDQCFGSLSAYSESTTGVNSGRLALGNIYYKHYSLCCELDCIFSEHLNGLQNGHILVYKRYDVRNHYR